LLPSSKTVLGEKGGILGKGGGGVTGGVIKGGDTKLYRPEPKKTQKNKIFFKTEKNIQKLGGNCQKKRKRSGGE